MRRGACARRAQKTAHDRAGRNREDDHRQTSLTNPRTSRPIPRRWGTWRSACRPALAPERARRRPLGRSHAREHAGR